MQSNSCSNCSNKADFLAAVQMPLEGAVIFHLFDALSITTLLSPKAVILNFLTALSTTRISKLNFPSPKRRRK